MDSDHMHGNQRQGTGAEAILALVEAIPPVNFADDLVKEPSDFIAMAVVDPPSFNLVHCLNEGWLGNRPNDHDYAA